MTLVKHTLTVVVCVLIVCTTASLEYPYSIVFASYASQVEACAAASGFAFRTNTTPNAHQIAETCGDPNCGLLLSRLMVNASDGGKNTTVFNSISTAMVTFGSPMVNFCWYSHLPDRPCPENGFLTDFLERFKVQVDQCALDMNVSFAEPNITRLKERVRVYTTESTHCSHICGQVSKRIRYAVKYATCKWMESNETIGTLHSMAGAVIAHCDMVEPHWTNGIYQYDPEWPIPIVPPEETTAPPSITNHSGSTDHEDDDSPPIIVYTSVSRVPASTQDTSVVSPTTPSVEVATIEEDTLAPPIDVMKAIPVVTTTSPTTSVPPTSTSAVVSDTSTRAPIESTTHRSSGHDLVYYVSIAGAVVLVVIMIVSIRARRDSTSPTAITSPTEPTQSSYTAIHPTVGDTSSGPLFPSSDSMQRNLISGLQPIPVDMLEDIRLIGTGGHGVVHLVRDTRDGRLLASKRLAKNQVTKESIDAFVQEIQLVSTLDHPYIVSFVGASWTNRMDVQALFEYMEGGDLRTFLDRTPVGPWTVQKVEIAINIADALAHVHTTLEPPIVHRDLKSRNVLLDESREHAKLADFGVARSISKNFSMTTGIGTSRWLAPEVIIGGGDYNAACDIYSFGVVLSELDTHRVPFSDRGAGPEAFMPEIAILTMVALDRLKPTFSDSCPPELLALAQRCLCHDPQNRPNAQEVGDKLRDIRIEILRVRNKRDSSS